MREAKGLLISEDVFRRTVCHTKVCELRASYYVIEKGQKRVFGAYCNRHSAEWVDEQGMTRRRRKPIDNLAEKVGKKITA